MYDVIIIGGGPAGIAAAVYAARKLLNILLISADIGGQVNWTSSVENYLGYQIIEGYDLISKFQQHVDQFPIDQKIGVKVLKIRQIETGFEVLSETGEVFTGKTVILATGKQPRRLNIPGEMELVGRGVTYCYVCDGPLFAGQRVVVVGGGNSALEATLDLVKVAEHVDLVSITPLTGDPIMIEKLWAAGNLTIHLEHKPETIRGKNLVEGLIIKDLKTGTDKQLDVTGIFIEIGLVPNSDLVKDIIRLSPTGEVPVDASCKTEIPGLFAAGDVTNVPEKQIVIAAGEGAKAALQAHSYLRRLPE
jgi:NADH-dependent peroxiredoxin subunit F